MSAYHLFGLQGVFVMPGAGLDSDAVGPFQLFTAVLHQVPSTHAIPCIYAHYKYQHVVL